MVVLFKVAHIFFFVWRSILGEKERAKQIVSKMTNVLLFATSQVNGKPPKRRTYHKSRITVVGVEQSCTQLLYWFLKVHYGDWLLTDSLTAREKCATHGRTEIFASEF